MNYESRVMAGRREKAKDLTVCGLFSALIAVGAFIKIVIPVGADSMNFTLQWFFVLLAGLLLGSKRAFLSVSTYLMIGLMGIPVFARGGGPAYLLRPTFGFLLGFALAAYAMGKICEWMHSSKPGTWIFAATVGYVIYYGMGILYFYFITHWIVVTPNTVGWGAIFAVYCLPTMFPDGVLCVLAIMVAGRLRPVVSQILGSV
ncbi:biotin transporter BioY [Enterocloster aldenensis]|uniref:biotin transporter BioY n=2 Tax=Enterocloster aldenensis TaxID=358742 RepID=UPI0025A38948|nr:biotin transporter BioY [Enterocloster aldenensis]